MKTLRMFLVLIGLWHFARADSVPPVVINSEVARAHRIEARLAGATTEDEVLAALREGWSDPPATYRPHTYWMWPGNAVTREGISFQLGQMKAKGFGGVRIVDMYQVHEVAEVRVNGREAGVAWMEPYRVDVTGMLRPGKNRLQIHVVNLLWNYAAGLSHPTPIPADLVGHYGGEPTAMRSWESLQKTKANRQNDRMPSGLIGPVQVIDYDIVSE